MIDSFKDSFYDFELEALWGGEDVCLNDIGCSSISISDEEE